ncbi:hypothetical protein Patl1_13712 [Pistacia atlantica]|uniref:Uncharacterized protein n=1 Tax=Pistacia atlantica TaxID=434234 RepID=A0ACC1AUR8_9ROSI|nr:hypothetical protein Patl1_13712 [Pistacia atlantica]
MLRKQKQIRLILNQFSNSFNLYHNNLDMMSYAIRTDPFCKGFHCRPQSSPLEGNICDGSNVNPFRIKTSKANGLILRGCFDSNKPTAADKKAGAFARQRVRYIEEVCSDASLFNGRGSNQRGNPLGFIDHTLPEKIAVAVDVDEVLGNFVSALNRFIADRYSSNHSVSEYHVYEFFKCTASIPGFFWLHSGYGTVHVMKVLLGISIALAADIRVHEFFKTPYFKTGIHPIPGAQKALHNLSRFCNLSVVTTTLLNGLRSIIQDCLRRFTLGNHFALDGTSRPKSEICRYLGAKILIDDNPKYAIECADAGMRVLLFDYENSYPWCKTQAIDQHPLVTKVNNWEEVEQQIVSSIVS